VSFEVLTVVKMSILVFWVVMPYGLVGRYHQHFGPEDEGSMFLQNVAIYQQVHIELLPRRPTSTAGFVSIDVDFHISFLILHERKGHA
jgi:hypothetical protein